MLLRFSLCSRVLRYCGFGQQVSDLRRELQDGTVLVDLIEIVAGDRIPGTHAKPANSAEMRENIDRVLQFMRSSRPNNNIYRFIIAL